MHNTGGDFNDRRGKVETVFLSLHRLIRIRSNAVERSTFAERIEVPRRGVPARDIHFTEDGAACSRHIPAVHRVNRAVQIGSCHLEGTPCRRNIRADRETIALDLEAFRFCLRQRKIFRGNTVDAVQIGIVKILCPGIEFDNLEIVIAAHRHRQRIIDRIAPALAVPLCG